MTEVSTAIAIRVGIAVLNRVTPTGLAWLKTKLVGRDILVVGQPRAGKTSLVRYLHHGVFAEPETEKTRKIKITAAFNVKIGRNESLQMQVRKAIDSVGQVAAEKHVELAASYRPHIMVIVLDVSGPWEGANEHAARYYLSEFFEYFTQAFTSKYLIRRKLKGVFIVLNKRDKITGKKLLSFSSKCKQLLENKLVPLGPFAKNVIIVDCSFLEDFDAGSSANSLIQKIALKLEDS
jgi:predicted GTPase